MSANRKPEESRAHARYLLQNQSLARVKFGNNHSYAIRDLSYSGFSINTALDRMSSDQVRFEILDTGVDSVAHLVHTTGTFTGFAFQHRTVETLIFLQPLIERLRIGRTLRPISKEMLDQKYRSSDWLVYRGDGPTDLKIQIMPEGITSMLLTFREGETYKEVRFQNGKLFTSKQVDTEGVSARMRDTATLERSSAKAALFVLAGIEDERIQAFLNQLVTLYLKP